MQLPVAFLGLPSVKDVVTKIAEIFAGALHKAFTPDWLEKAGSKVFSWLVAVPNPAAGQAKHILELTSYTTAFAWGLLSVVAVVAAVRYYFVGITGRTNPLDALLRIFGAAVILTAYTWLFTQAIALVNLTTKQIFAWPVVKSGLADLADVMFLAGAGITPLGALMQLIGLFVVLALFAVKVALMIVLIMIFVSGPLAISLMPMPEFRGVLDGWVDAFTAVLMVPIVWTLLFATAAVVVRDIPALLGMGNSGFASTASKVFFTPVFGLMVLWIGFSSARSGLASIKASGRRLTAAAAPGGGGGRVGGFTAGLVAGEAGRRVRGAMSGSDGGTTGLRQMALTAAAGSAAAPAAAPAAAAGAANAAGASQAAAAGANAKTPVTSDNPAAAKPSIPQASPSSNDRTAPKTDAAPKHSATAVGSSEKIPPTPAVPPPATERSKPLPPAAPAADSTPPSPTAAPVSPQKAPTPAPARTAERTSRHKRSADPAAPAATRPTRETARRPKPAKESPASRRSTPPPARKDTPSPRKPSNPDSESR